MLEVALMIAALWHHPPDLVEAVYSAPARVRVPISRLDSTWLPSGLENVSVVQGESHFNPTAEGVEPGGTSYGLFQRYDRYHEQYRGDVGQHILSGTAHLGDCLALTGGNFARAVAHYNGGTRPGAISRDWGTKTERRRDSLALYVWRRMR